MQLISRMGEDTSADADGQASGPVQVPRKFCEELGAAGHLLTLRSAIDERGFPPLQAAAAVIGCATGRCSCLTTPKATAASTCSWRMIPTSHPDELSLVAALFDVVINKRRRSTLKDLVRRLLESGSAGPDLILRLVIHQVRLRRGPKHLELRDSSDYFLCNCRRSWPAFLVRSKRLPHPHVY